MASIIDTIYTHLKQMSASDQKVAQFVLAHPQTVINMTISALSKQAGVSDASVTRFCHNLKLVGFHDLKIQLAQTDKEENDSLSMPQDNLQAALSEIEKKKVAEIKATLSSISSKTLNKVLHLLQTARLIQVNAEGDTYPVASDAVYKFNQIGLLAFASGGDQATAIAQTMNLQKGDCLLVISNSGEAASILKQIKVAKKHGLKIIALTNRADSPIALAADYHLQTAVRQNVLQSQYYFSRVSAFALIEALFLLLINQDEARTKHIQAHEALISNQKI